MDSCPDNTRLLLPELSDCSGAKSSSRSTNRPKVNVLTIAWITSVHLTDAFLDLLHSIAPFNRLGRVQVSSNVQVEVLDDHRGRIRSPVAPGRRSTRCSRLHGR